MAYGCISISIIQRIVGYEKINLNGLRHILCNAAKQLQ